MKLIFPINGWTDFFIKESKKVYFITLIKRLSLISKKNILYPATTKIFDAFNICDLINTKVVIIGQDPYHNPFQANGLAFSVAKNVQLPPSLKNIFKELKNDIGVIKNNGNLTNWANQGVLLLNSILTVSAHQPRSHHNLGWEIFTNQVIKYLDQMYQPIFVCWGKDAQRKITLIKYSHIISSTHPSPFSARYGFLGSKPFSQINKLLTKKGQTTIIWEDQND